MITNGFTYVAVLCAIAGVLLAAEKYTKNKYLQKFFNVIPPIVLIYLIGMIFCTIGVWDLEKTKPAYDAIKNNMLYAMIFLMLLGCDFRKIVKVGPKMALAFFVGSFTVVVGTVVVFIMMKGTLGLESWKALAALSGSWVGGSANMAALQEVLQVNEVDYGAALVVDSIGYSIWFMIILWAVRFEKKFNTWTKAESLYLDEFKDQVGEEAATSEQNITAANLMLLIGSALLVSAIGQNVGALIADSTGLLNQASWCVLFITVVGLVCAMSPLGKIAGTSELSSVFLYIVISLLASRASLVDIAKTPAWLLAGFIILVIHGVLFIILAKLLKMDLFQVTVSSIANIGGTGGGAIVAGNFKEYLGPIGVLTALLGTVFGTYLGMLCAKIMELLV